MDTLFQPYRLNGTLTLAVNGKVVSGGDKCFWRKGYTSYNYFINRVTF